MWFILGFAFGSPEVIDRFDRFAAACLAETFLSPGFACGFPWGMTVFDRFAAACLAETFLFLGVARGLPWGMAVFDRFAAACLAETFLSPGFAFGLPWVWLCSTAWRPPAGICLSSEGVGPIGAALFYSRG